MFGQTLAGNTVFNGAHPEEVSGFVNDHIGHHRLELKGQSTAAASLSFREFAGFGLSRISYGNQVRVKSPELDSIYHFQIVTRGECVWHQSGERLRLRTGEAMMVNPYEKIDLEYSADCEKLIIKVPEPVLESARSARPVRHGEEKVRFERTPVDLKLCPTLANILSAVFCELEEGGDEEVGLVSLPYREIILKKLLKVFPSNCASDDGQPAFSPAVCRMVRYIDQNLKRNIDVEELSAISNMSVRSIYNAFSKGFATTPKYYVKQRKLQQLREDLLAGQCRNVTEVALDYGFSHLGRFSSDYRKMFGELPSETLRMAG
ncbi:AraC family transcriptional regulator [Marinobacter sp. M216]|uniref:AraC family transcriptional regulator n=1 Tax=Marinobacter albus TaxID=3030833 RepID=A0ABT7HE64_9GAMM|nr:AraC family transcriptional regulator [Marinobacter sp. M216]MDK9558654.1 AraC family transcriptional regulator [Marinobacter sp. M216]